MFNKGDKMSLEQVISTQNESLNQIISSLEGLVLSYKNNGVNLEEIKKIINANLEEMNINEESLKESILEIVLENKESLKGDTGKSAYEIWLENEENKGKSEDEFLASLKGKIPAKEEIKPIVEEVLENMNLNSGINGIKVSTSKPTPKTKANVNDLIITYNENLRQFWLCVASDDKYTSWVNLLGNENITAEDLIIISFDANLGSGSYGGCLSDLRFGFENALASTTQIVKGLNEGGFLITKDGRGLNSKNYTEVNILSKPSQNQIEGRIKTSGIYNDPTWHNITNALKKYDGNANECCLWTSNVKHSVSVELLTNEFPTNLFYRKDGYYGNVNLSNIKMQKVLRTQNEILIEQSFVGIKKEIDKDIYGNNAFLFEFEEKGA